MCKLAGPPNLADIPLGSVDETNDPWKHRSKNMTCRTCMYFVKKEGMTLNDNRGYLGRCRRHAPTMSGFPAVFEIDWCGDHKLDENKK